ncbi:DUF4055 domain-containing protein [Cereibacter sphaeroides]|nr:DUF4055 domain-containing protein [Cereibacter sphaeroides]
MDITTRHPAYTTFAPSWRLMRDAVAGEDDIKGAGEQYLPMKSGQAAMKDAAKQKKAFEAYAARAEFPEIVAPTIRGAVGVMFSKPAEIQLPTRMEHLLERATIDGLTMDSLQRRIATEVMTTGRYGLLPGIRNGVPHLAGYTAESIINWDSTDGEADFAVLDETGWVRNRETGSWAEVERYRECTVLEGRYVSRLWSKGSGGWEPAGDEEARTPRGAPLSGMPLVFIGSMDITPSPDDVPLYGLAKLAVRAYRLDADRSWALHMTSEPTPWMNGFNDAQQAIEDGAVPQGLGSAALWILPEGAQAGYLEFSGPGLAAQADAIADTLERAAHFGAQVIQRGSSAESGEALKLRAASQTATLTTIAQTVASGLEKALRNIATWIDADPDQVTVTPNLDFFDRTMTADEARAVWEGWQNGVYDYRSVIEKLKHGNWLPSDADADDIAAAMLTDGNAM